MFGFVGLPVHSILLNITIPPGPEVTPTTTSVTGRRIMRKIISMENKGKERSIILQFCATKQNLNLMYRHYF